MVGFAVVGAGVSYVTANLKRMLYFGGPVCIPSHTITLHPLLPTAEDFKNSSMILSHELMMHCA